MNRYPNFSLAEFIESDTASKRRIDNTPDFNEVDHINELVSRILQPLRSAWGRPLKVTSGYRCPKLNAAVGGASTSAHLRGYAADIQPATGTVDEFIKFAEKWLRDNGIPFDQSIREKSGRVEWWHIGLYSSTGEQRRQFKAITK